MCTAAWRRLSHGYELVFNRDELWTRLPSTEPTLESDNAIQGICSRDTDAGGTWLFTNEIGLTVAVLNAYPAGRILSGKRTRGQLPVIAGQLDSTEAVSAFIKTQNLQDFAPFYLIAMDGKKECCLLWNGEKLTTLNIPDNRFITTSSVRTGFVRIARTKRFNSLNGKSLTERLNDTAAKNPEEALFVTRDDGGTVSKIIVFVSADEVHFSFIRRDNTPIQLATPRMRHANLP